MMKVEFTAQIRQLKMAIDSSGDKGGSVTFIFRDEKKTLEKLNAVMKMDSECKVMVEG